MERIDRLKEKAEYFLENNVKAFIKDSANNFYFCDLLVVGETHLLVENFSGQREGKKSQILWLDVEVFSEYREGRE